MTPLALTLDDLAAAMALAQFDGRAAQRRLEPTDRGDRPPGAARADVRQAAALLYAFEREGRVHFPLTERAAALRSHRGQISLPGGRPEPDEALRDTAWREAGEEIGLDVTRAQDLGWLAPVYIPVTHTRLHVCVASGPDPGAFIAQPEEVASIGLARLDGLLDPARRVTRTLAIRQRPVAIRHLLLGGFEVWGATAMALSELSERLREVQSQRSSS